ncbi:MAG: hypothetical protein IH820_13690 [Bacteroidetes bacterium]|nr:hypothetical protein [Bacteroidota bacterium]
MHDIEKKEIKRHPRPPFITSTLQQEAWSRIRFSAKKTMFIAQQLYEGIELESEGQTGLITYMRTDSTTLSESSLKDAKDFINKNIGASYALDKHRRFKTKSILRCKKWKHQLVNGKTVLSVMDV